MTNVYGYLRSKGDKLDIDAQTASIKLVLQLNGYAVGTGNWKSEVTYNGDTVIRDHLLKNAKPGDVIAVAKPSCIHPEPLQLIDIASQFMAKGAVLLVASAPGGHLDLQVLRSLSEPLFAMQSRIDDLTRELQEQAAEHAAEFSQFQTALETQIASYLQERGVTLAHLLKPKGDIEGGSPVARPDEGRKVRDLREKLHLSQSEAGALVEPSLDKAAVSRCESLGSAAPRYSEYSVALDVEYVLKNEEAKQRARGVNPNPTPENEAIVAVRNKILGNFDNAMSQADQAYAEVLALKVAT